MHIYSRDKHFTKYYMIPWQWFPTVNERDADTCTSEGRSWCPNLSDQRCRSSGKPLSVVISCKAHLRLKVDTCFRSCDKMLVSNYSVCYPFTGSTAAKEREWEEHQFCPTPNVTWRHAGYSSDRLNIKICVLPRLRLGLTKCFNNARLHFRSSSVRTGKSEGPG